MQVLDPLVLKERYKNITVKVDSYFLLKTNLLANQTILKLGEYNLIGAPAFLSMEEISLLVVLSPGEVTLFSRFSQQLSTLMLHFNDPEVTDPLRYHLKVSLVSIQPLPNRKNVSLMKLKLKTCPTEIVNLLGGYIEQLDAQKDSYEKQALEMIDLTPENSKLLGYNEVAELVVAEVKTEVEVVQLSSKFVVFNVPGAEPPKESTGLRLYFRAFQFTNMLSEILPSGTPQQYKATMSFSAELISILDDYKFRVTMTRRNTGD